MKELNKIILKEKQKDQPNKSYIQWLQQLSDKKLTENFIAEVKQKKFLEDLYKQNTIDMDDYFKYSGKTEKSTEDYSYIERNVSDFDKFHKKNRKKMAKKIEKYNQIISNERSKNYKKWRKK